MGAVGGSQEFLTQTDQSLNAGFYHRTDWGSLSFLIHYLGGIAMGIPTLMGIRGGSSETGLCSASVGFVLTVLAASSHDSQESGHQMLTSVSPPKQSQLGGQKWKGRGRRGSVRVLPLPPVHKHFQAQPPAFVSLQAGRDPRRIQRVLRPSVMARGLVKGWSSGTGTAPEL